MIDTVTVPWRDFKADPPYDSYEDEQKGCEVDAVCAWFVYRHTHRPPSMNSGPFLSEMACCFVNGVFRGYEAHMQTSPYPTDKIEILAWVEDRPVRDAILGTWRPSKIRLAEVQERLEILDAKMREESRQACTLHSLRDKLQAQIIVEEKFLTGPDSRKCESP